MHKLKNILITGATGFIGQELLKRLCKLDLNISVVTRGGNLNSLNGRITIIHVNDIFHESEQWWAQVCKGVDLVIHLAWYVNPLDYLTSRQNLNCLLGSIELAKGAASAGVKKFIGVGTCFEYDCSTFSPIEESHKLDPKTLYASSKAALFYLLKSLFDGAKIDFCWARFFFLYGEGENPSRLVPFVIDKLNKGELVPLTEGTQIRDFLSVEDAVSQLIEICFGEKTGAINICSGQPITVREFVENIAASYGRQDLLLFGARPANLFDPAYIVGKK